jgi:putative solute:sodium symporter small subunit
MEILPKNHRLYWKSVQLFTAGLLSLWFLTSFGAGIIFREFLDQYFIGGAPLGFWFAQQGAIYVFLIIIIIYCLGMNYLEKKYGLDN